MAIAGGFGGFLSWVYTLAVGTPLKVDGVVGVMISMLLGLGASLIGVYVLANSDRQALVRCLVFAMLCGFSWKPVFDAGTASITLHTERQETREQLSELTAETSETVALIEKTPPAERAQDPVRLVEATQKAGDMLRVAGKLDDPEAKTRAAKAVKRVVDSLRANHGAELPPALAVRVDNLDQNLQQFAEKNDLKF